MFAAALSGFVMGGTLIIAVGAQNSFFNRTVFEASMDRVVRTAVYSERCHFYQLRSNGIRVAVTRISFVGISH